VPVEVRQLRVQRHRDYAASRYDAAAGDHETARHDETHHTDDQTAVNQLTYGELVSGGGLRL
jgi:hypothetical protein